MNTLSNNPAAALQLAHQTISDRIHQAQTRAQVRALRAQRRAARRARQAIDSPRLRTRFGPASTWFTRPAH